MKNPIEISIIKSLFLKKKVCSPLLANPQGAICAISSNFTENKSLSICTLSVVF